MEASGLDVEQRVQTCTASTPVAREAERDQLESGAPSMLFAVPPCSVTVTWDTVLGFGF